MPYEDIESAQRLLQSGQRQGLKKPDSGPEPREFPWVLSDAELILARRPYYPAAATHESVGNRVTCRGCGEAVPAGARRLSFRLYAPRDKDGNLSGWITKQGHLHFGPCTKSAERLQYESDSATLDSIVEAQFEEFRAEFPEPKSSDEVGFHLFAYPPEKKRKR